MLTYHRFVSYMSALYTLAFLEQQLLCIQVGSASGYPPTWRQGVLYGNKNSGVKIEPKIGLVRWDSTLTPDYIKCLNSYVVV